MYQTRAPEIPFIQSRAVAWFLTPRFRDEVSYDAYNQRTVVLISLTLAIWGVFFSLFQWSVLNAPSMAIPTAAATLVAVASLLLYRFSATTPWPGLIVCGVLLGLLGWLSFQTGGITSPVIFWVLLVPMAAHLLLQKRRLTYQWSAMAILVVAAMFAASLSGVEAPMVLEMQWHRELLFAMSTVGLVFASITIFGIRQRMETWLLNQARSEEAEKLRSETELRQFHQRAREDARESLRTLMKNSPDGIVVHTEQEVVYANPAFRRLVGYDVDETFGGEILDELQEGLDLGREANALDETGDGMAINEHELTCRNGETVACEITAFQARLDQKPVTISVVRDLSRRRELQANMMELDRMVAVGTLAAGVAHEINNPLAFIHSNVEFLVRRISSEKDGELVYFDGLDRDEVKGTFLDVLEGSRRVRDIVSDLRAFSTSENSALVPVDLEQILESAIKMASNQIRQRARLTLDFEDLPTIRCNESGLAQIFLNLLINASQAIPAGAPNDNEICVTTREFDDVVVVEIIDTGEGIAADRIDRIFDPFVSSKTQDEGMGLGLSICRNQIRDLGGRIEVESTPGEGSTFRVVIPKRLTMEESADMPIPQQIRRLGSSRIIVVDDEPRLLRAQKRQLEGHFKVETFEVPKEALEALQKGAKPVMILCDLQMPEMSGVEFFQHLQQQRPDWCDAVAFMTGGAFTKDVREFVESTDRPMLEKPFALEELLEIIDQSEREETV